MKIVDRWEDFVHTHFATDGQRMTEQQVAAVREGAQRILREHGIVFGVHFDRRHWDGGIRLVLECRPRRRELDTIHRRFAELLAPIPVRPPVSTTVQVDRPGGGPHEQDPQADGRQADGAPDFLPDPWRA